MMHAGIGTEKTLTLTKEKEGNGAEIVLKDRSYVATVIGGNNPQYVCVLIEKWKQELDYPVAARAMKTTTAGQDLG